VTDASSGTTDTAATTRGDSLGSVNKLFGEGRTFVERGQDRRSIAVEHAAATATRAHVEAVRHDPPAFVAGSRAHEADRALRLGRGDALASGLTALGVLVFVVTIVAGTIILNNARDVGAFSNPWNSNRVAIGLGVLAFGIIHTALLLGVARAIAYQRASARLQMRAYEHAEQVDLTSRSVAAASHLVPVTE